MKNASRVLGLVILLGSIARPWAATDTLTGTVTDAATKTPLGQVLVASGAVSILTDETGFFRLLFPSASVLRGSAKTPLAAWNGSQNSIQWSPEAGAVAIAIRDLEGRLVARYNSAPNPALTSYRPPNLPKGLLLASVEARSSRETFKFFHAGAGSETGRANGQILAARTQATDARHDLVFSKTGYLATTLAAPAGTKTPLLVGLVKNPGARSLFDGKTLAGWTPVAANNWTVNAADAAIQGTGAGRGYVYTNEAYLHYRVTFWVRQTGTSDHTSCVLIFGQNNKADAMGAVQFQLPKAWGWDYRPGKNNSGGAYIKGFPSPNINLKEWAQCELVVNTRAGTAVAAVAQPPGTKATKILSFSDPAVKTYNPASFGIQAHNGGLHDEYKNIAIEVDPATDDLVTTK